MSTTNQLLAGQTFGRYQIVRLIGAGGMGAVYEATHPTLKKRFAIKTLLPAIADKEEARARFLREGEAASRINHPNVVTVLDVGIEDRIPYLVMEFLAGETLADFLARRGSVEASDTLVLLLPVFSAVATGHENGVVHRDLKPQNIFLAQGPWGDRIPKVLDFGVSKLAGDESAVITRTLTVLGTAAYMSPEQARGARNVGVESDQFSLGLILYEMLSGCRAHPGDNQLEILHNVASGAIRPVRELKPELPDGLITALTRILAPGPFNRYPSLKEAGRALLPFADTKTQTVLAGAFETPLVAVRPSSAIDQSDGTPPHAAGGTAALPLQVSDARVNTTLGEAAAENALHEGAAWQLALPKGRKTWLAVAGAVVLGSLGTWLWSGNANRTAKKSSLGEQSHPVAAEPGEVPPTFPAIASIKKPIAVLPMPVRPRNEMATTTPFEIRVVPADAEIALDDRAPTRHLLEVVLPLAGSSHTIRVSAAGYLSKTVTFGPDERPPAEIRLERMPSPASAPARGAAALPGSNPRKVAEAATKRRPTGPAADNHTPEAAKPFGAPVVPKRGSNNALILK